MVLDCSKKKPVAEDDKTKAVRKTTPLELYPGPVCGPERLGGESVSNYLSQLRLGFSPVGIIHLSQTFCNPFPVGCEMRSGSHVRQEGLTLAEVATSLMTWVWIQDQLDEEDRKGWEGCGVEETCK